MLVLTRELNESIVLTVGSTRVLVQILDVRARRVRVGITAPLEVIVERGELITRHRAPDPAPPGTASVPADPPSNAHHRRPQAADRDPPSPSRSRRGA